MKKRLTLLLLAAAPARALACTVCFNPADYQTRNAVNNAILFMIGVTAVVLIGITWMVVHTIRLHRKTQQPS